MIYARLKGFKYEHIKRTQGLEKATEYASRSIYLWSKFTINGYKSRRKRKYT